MEKKGRRQPPSAVQMLVAYDFEAEGHPEMSVHKGDRVLVLDLDPQLNGWAYARKENDNEGYIPASYIRHINNENSNMPSNAAMPIHTQIPNQMQMQMPMQQQPQQQMPPMQSQMGAMPMQMPMGAPMNHNNARHPSGGPMSASAVSGATGPPSNASAIASNAPTSAPMSHAHPHSHPHSHPSDRTIVCSFHRDYVPRVQDLTKYFGRFGQIVNNVDIDTKKTTPIAYIVFDSQINCNKVLSEGTEIRIPSATSDTQMYRVRVYSKIEYERMPQSRFRGHGGGGHGSHSGGPVNDTMRRR